MSAEKNNDTHIPTSAAQVSHLVGQVFPALTDAQWPSKSCTTYDKIYC